MFLDNLSFYELVMINGLILVFLGFFAFKWFFKQIRQICEKASGFLVLGQVTFLLFSWGCFLAVFLVFIYTGEKISALSLILTVVVGFLGTITGILFNQDAIRRLYEDRLGEKDERIKSSLEWRKEFNKALIELKKD